MLKRFLRVPAILGLVSAPMLPMYEQGATRIIEEGQPPVVIHGTVDVTARAHEAGGPFGGGASSNLSYRGGTNGIGVETAPKVYVVFWGSQWNNNDPSGEATILEGFLSGVGGSSWLNSVVQYCQGVSSGTVFCNGAGTPAGNPTGILAGFWYDNASSAPSRPKQSQLAAEARQI